MNIGIFTDAYYPQINGVVISTQILKEELENQGHHVTIITVSDPNIVEDHDNVLRISSIPFAILPNFRVGSVYSRRIMKQLKALNLDIIHTQTEFTLGIFARIVAKQLNIPIVHTYHTMYEDYTHYFSPKRMEKAARKVTRKLSCYLCRTVDNVIVPTKKVEDKLIDYGFRKDINVIPTGVNLRPFDPSTYTSSEIAAVREEVGLDDSDQAILFVGRIAKEKSIDVIVKSMPQVLQANRYAKLVIIGDGPEVANLKTLTKSLSIEDKVIFTGKKPWKNIGKYYQIASVFVSASTSETQGLTFIEAMAAKKPVVAKYDTNLTETINDGVNGRFFFTDDQLGPILINILDDELLSKSLSNQAYQTATYFSSITFAESVAKVYEKTIGHEEVYHIR